MAALGLPKAAILSLSRKSLSRPARKPYSVCGGSLFSLKFVLYVRVGS